MYAMPEELAAAVPGDAGALRYAVIAPVLVSIGSMMMGSLKTVDWKDPAKAVPAFLTLLVMPLSFSITDGIAWGCIATTVIAVGTGRVKSTSPLVHAFSLLFVLRYIYMLRL